MGVRYLKPVTSASRGCALVSREGLWKGKPEKSLTVGKASCGGRNSFGRITVRHRGGGHKRSYRLVDFRRSKIGEAVVERIEYDPNRTAFLALLVYGDGEKSYVLAPKGLKEGDVVSSGEGSDVLLGNCLPLRCVPIGSFVYNIELRPGGGGKISRSAGCYSQVIGKDGVYVLLRMRSGQVRLILSECRATIGVVSNADRQNVKLAKAGRSRWLGRRPVVRGVAMNPVDHPHGGGEGKTSGGRHPVTPWGVATKGKKTRKKGKSSDKYMRYLSSKKKR